MALVGWARVSTQDQSLEAQLDELEAAGCEKIFHGKQSGKSLDNLEQLNRLVEYVREGDVVVLTRLDRMGRSLNSILNTIQELQGKGVHVQTLDGQVDTASNSPMQKAMTQLLGVFSELEHSIIVDRLQSGRERTGNKGGRKSALTDEQRKEVLNKLANNQSVSSIAKEYDVSRQTIMRVRDKATK